MVLDNRCSPWAEDTSRKRRFLLAVDHSTSVTGGEEVILVRGGAGHGSCCWTPGTAVGSSCGVVDIGCARDGAGAFQGFADFGAFDFVDLPVALSF